jgi:hypothetical protein
LKADGHDIDNFEFHVSEPIPDPSSNDEHEDEVVEATKEPENPPAFQPVSPIPVNTAEQEIATQEEEPEKSNENVAEESMETEVVEAKAPEEKEVPAPSGEEVKQQDPMEGVQSQKESDSDIEIIEHSENKPADVEMKEPGVKPVAEEPEKNSCWISNLPSTVKAADLKVCFMRSMSLRADISDFVLRPWKSSFCKGFHNAQHKESRLFRLHYNGCGC